MTNHSTLVSKVILILTIITICLSFTSCEQKTENSTTTADLVTELTDVNEGNAEEGYTGIIVTKLTEKDESIISLDNYSTQRFIANDSIDISSFNVGDKVNITVNEPELNIDKYIKDIKNLSNTENKLIVSDRELSFDTQVYEYAGYLIACEIPDSFKEFENSTIALVCYNNCEMYNKNGNRTYKFEGGENAKITFNSYSYSDDETVVIYASRIDIDTEKTYPKEVIIETPEYKEQISIAFEYIHSKTIMEPDYYLTVSCEPLEEYVDEKSGEVYNDVYFVLFSEREGLDGSCTYVVLNAKDNSFIKIGFEVSDWSKSDNAN